VRRSIFRFPSPKRCYPSAILTAAQGDGELSGTAIECSMTGTFRVVLHKKADLADRPFADLTYPLIETETDWVLTGFSHPNYLAEFGRQGTKRGVCEIIARSCDEGRVSQGSAISS